MCLFVYLLYALVGSSCCYDIIALCLFIFSQAENSTYMYVQPSKKMILQTKDTRIQKDFV